MKSYFEYEIDLDNIEWDLDGLINIDLLSYGSSENMSILLDVARSTEKYARSLLFDIESEFTTSPEIYNKLGLLAFSFHYSEVNNEYHYSLLGNFFENEYIVDCLFYLSLILIVILSNPRLVNVS